MVETEIKIQRYESYKDSGVEWLGEIPEHWETRRIKYIFNEINERSEDGNEDLLSVSQYTGVTNKSDKVEAGGMLTNAETLEGYKKVAKGDLVSNIMLAWNGSLGFSPFNGITSPAYSIYRIYGENDNRYFHYLLRTELYKAEFKRNSSGVIESRLRLYTDDFFKIEAILPPLPEQTAIAQFLDDKTTKIDQAIAIKQQQIALLKERKQILIHKAVTRGVPKRHPELDSGSHPVKLKDAGVEWIGEIPEHWEVASVKYILEIPITDGPHTTPQLYEVGIPFISAEAIKNGKIDFNKKRGFISEKDHQLFCLKYKPKRNDIYMVKSGATTGNIAMVNTDEEFSIWSPLAVFRTNNDRMLPSFLYNFLESQAFKKGVELSWSFGTQQNIGMGVLSNLPISIPPLSEQKEIANYIETASAKIENAINLKEQEISKLQEYKSSLINSVVTGKVKVL
ncbi:restriction endonuclease subunit S [Marixanthomonas sp. SCSIO 43207]|uniref:restriction endonuclease subunit S n=1 Tax=Marixanthomonas sp. SCSIO 43207 TaxID=2779360 RepID=UPI001CA96859|nr:restriction endonuclease subunit S [Marixanthomonas sp. SCSIO 43207]UAB80051.1 restriction endonuclease subunit S [Marixanthomonas sp. SCSIO 43207]